MIAVLKSFDALLPSASKSAIDTAPNATLAKYYWLSSNEGSRFHIKLTHNYFGTLAAYAKYLVLSSHCCTCRNYIQWEMM